MYNDVKHILFDWDHTLWDFEKNSKETLLEVYHHFKLNTILKCSTEDFVRDYDKIIKKMWGLYDHNKITKEELRTSRFNLLFEKHNIINPQLAKEVDDFYINTCPKKNSLVENALPTIKYLANKYKLHIITNGFLAIQKTKIKHSGLSSYFSSLTTSECSGHKKPHPKIFHHLLEKINASPKECLMIGDNLKTDIRGAKQVNMNAIYFALNDKTYHPKRTQISNLNQLLDIL